MKIINLFKELIETQKEINKNLEILNKQKMKLESDLYSSQSTISSLQTIISTNVYTKEETTEAINKEIDYKERLKKVQKQCPELLELIEIISTNYAKMDKYAILNTTEMFSKEYKVAKVKEEQ